MGFKFGVAVGSLLGAAGIAYAMSDRRTRKRIMRDGKKTAAKASDFIERLM